MQKKAFLKGNQKRIFSSIVQEAPDAERRNPLGAL